MTTSRTTALTIAATALALATVAGCNDDTGSAAQPAPTSAAASASPTASPTATASSPATTAPAPANSAATGSASPAAEGAFDPEQALAAADKSPYAVSVVMITESGGVALSTMKGRSNLNGVWTGRMEMRTTAPGVAEPILWIESLTTADASYLRDLSTPGDEWAKMPRSTDNAVVDYTDYAKLLLAAGPGARKGMETRDGVAVYHLTGHISTEQLSTVDPRTYKSLKAKGTTGFDFDQWIDRAGRTRYAEQQVEMKGVKAVNKVTFSDFGPAETFAAPVAG
ncbi:LppX_LprAFG lipoprotein [Kitasatospora sp. NBC_01246]|uniref:LppX_LprAFG lipoprotein n=1 Tax=Kitasatospora sp. NBC_01246 TaxID=2903570 RepID=UPI002E2F4E32|nr:LppX_LprAFG lipoprotein [Kitasatospora sp. NBC_01246]